MRKRRRVSSNIHDTNVDVHSARWYTLTISGRRGGKFLLDFFHGVSRRFRYRCIELCRSRGGVGRRRALFPARVYIYTNTHTHELGCLSFSRLVSSSLFSLVSFASPLLLHPSVFPDRVWFFAFPPRLSVRPSSVSWTYKALYTSPVVSCTHRRNACVVLSRVARGKERNSKSKVPWLVIHRRSAPAVSQHYLRVSRQSELLIRPDAGGKCAPTFQGGFSVATIVLQVANRSDGVFFFRKFIDE